MALPIDVAPYTLSGVIGSDNYLTYYRATIEGNDDFVITEFNPAYMVSRGSGGQIEVLERFVAEFARERDEFVRRGNELEAMESPFIFPVLEVFERNNTAYIVTRASQLTTIDGYMGSQQMDPVEAYRFLSPLILTLARAHSLKIIFNINYQDFRVSNAKEPVLCAPIMWTTDFETSVIQIARLFYRLCTGAEPLETGTPSFKVYDVDISPRLEGAIMEILGGEVMYGSIDDFYKRFRSFALDVDDGTGDDGILLKRILQSVAAVLVVLLLGSLVWLTFGASEAIRAGSFWANPDVFAGEEIPAHPPNDFSGITLTHPRSTADALTRSFALYDGFLFLRNSAGMQRRRVEDMLIVPGAMGVLAAAEDLIILSNVRPSFIVGHGGMVYFVDTAAGGYIYRALVNGGDLERVTDHPALNLAVHGNFLFYTNPEDNNNLYRKNLANSQIHTVMEMPVYDVIVYNDNMFVLAGVDTGQGLGVFSICLEDYTLTALIGGAAHGLRSFIDRVYYVDMHGRLASIMHDGTDPMIHMPYNVRSFDVFFQWIIFTEHGRHNPRAYNMHTGVELTLSNTEWVSYVWVHDGLIYAIDHRSPTTIHYFHMPGQ